MDARDGLSPTQNAGRLLVVPYGYPTWKTTQDSQKQKQCVTGEPDTWKLVSPVRGGGVEKGQYMHLVGVLLYHWAHESREDDCHSPAAVLGDATGTVYPESVLSRILFATRYVRNLDKHGFLRFQDWKFYGERGLAKAKVTVWIYEGSLKVEKAAVTLSEYEVSMLDDHKHVQAVRSARTHETPFRSPQLTLFDLGPDAWLLYWKTPDHAPAHRRRRIRDIVQLPLFELAPLEKAVGADEGSGATHPRNHLHLVEEPDTSLGTQE